MPLSFRQGLFTGNVICAEWKISNFKNMTQNERQRDYYRRERYRYQQQKENQAKVWLIIFAYFMIGSLILYAGYTVYQEIQTKGVNNDYRKNFR